MKFLFPIASFIFCLNFIGCAQSNKSKIIDIIGDEEYDRLMKMSGHDFDQSPDGFRQYSGNYELAQLLIPEFITTNKLTPRESRNLHWHMGQIHAFQGNNEQAISEMEQAFEGGSTTWACYVDGSIAFLKKDKKALAAALELLRKQDNQMNIEILEKFLKYFDSTYAEAYNAAY